MMVLLLGTGLLLTVRAGFPQLTLLGRAWKLLSSPKGTEAAVTPRQALCTALAATVGTGNIIGVAGAICLGGPGAVFWMWVSGFLGMATKFAEVTLAGQYQITRGNERLGGPMYTISRGMPPRWRFLAELYSFFGLAAAFGVGNATQINAVVSGVRQILGHGSLGGDFLLGLLLAACLGAVLLGGVRRIGRVAEKLVPLASFGYVALCLLVIGLRRQALVPAVRSIFRGAFSPKAVTGGAIFSWVRCLGVGCSRGIFTNEAGMGTASMAYSAAPGESVEKGILGLMEVFTDTIVICTLTALAVLCGGVPIPYGTDAGADLAATTFSAVCGSWAGVALTAFLCVFAFATVLGWGLYGARCGEFLFGPGFFRLFAWLQMAGVVLGAVMGAQIVWLLAELVNGLMALPNLAALLYLNQTIQNLTIDYKRGG